MSNTGHFVMCGIGFTMIVGCALGLSQPIGQSTTVQFGIVRAADPVTLDSTAGQGALIGGTLGLAFGGSDSRAVNAIRGGTLGGAKRAASEGDRSGMSYTVEMPGGSSTRVVTDQREIRVGDCVAVEQVGDTANIRRMAPGYCDPANGQALKSVDATVKSEAMECQKAKQELAKATTDEMADLATRKIKLLCDT
jgi:outer membrane lipoprotein SlyB